MFRYLSEESDESVRMGAVGVGVIAGYLMGLRGGFFKRMIFAGTGGMAMSALCYPQETYELSQKGLQETKKYVKIAYNFVYGGKYFPYY